ncbi:efflux RND transporter permease subunit [Pinisolibacter sp. B13]|nr:efflux RND transporter permease subunit [Pinisolibacter aquiterrae]MCC8236351.1 efflux RND transporter permease subunit [Pinisolibacter aquiterrae]
MDLSRPFIRRPVGTTLLAAALMMVGIVAWGQLPVASLPAVDLPTIRIQVSRPGADPATMAATVAAPLERSLGTIAGVSELTSTSTFGSTGITVQFDPSRKVDGAARDVQAAINAAVADLPSDLNSAPVVRKMNPAAAPVLILALTSDTMGPADIYDVADTTIVQTLSQVEGVADVSVAGGEQPAIRVRLSSARMAAAGIGLDAVRSAIAKANVHAALGGLHGDRAFEVITSNSALATPEAFARVIVKADGDAIVRLGDIAEVTTGVRNTRSVGWFGAKPSVLLFITRQVDANVITTVDGVKAAIAGLDGRIPAGLEISTVSDRTVTIRASVADTEKTLVISMILVMGVVIAFLGRWTPTFAAGVTVPLALAGTFVAMWIAGFSIDNLSLMALTIAVGFVVDDAIVMIESIHRRRAEGLGPIDAALDGARRIAFTVVAIGLSLIAAFIPLMFTGGIIGMFFSEFSFTMTFAIVVSTVVSLTVTPMICAHLIRSGPPSRMERISDRVLERVSRAYGDSLGGVLRRPWWMVLLASATVGLTVWFFITLPKGMVPQDDTGLVFAFTEASPDVSFPRMMALQREATDRVMADPMVVGVASSVSGSSGGQVNQGRMFLSLKSVKEGGEPSLRVIDRLRRKLASLGDIRVFMFPMQDVRAGGRSGKSPYQFTLWNPDLDELVAWAPKVVKALEARPELVDVSADRQTPGLEARVVIDRVAASRLGVSVRDVDAALGDAFAQRQISTIYGGRNQYKVVLEIDPDRARDPTDLSDLWVSAADGTQVPLAAVAKIERATAPLGVSHQGAFPSITVTWGLAEGASADAANAAVRAAFDALHPPDTLHAEFAGDAKELAKSGNSTWVLVVTALAVVYIILGVLYESLIHPLTIISTLPPAGLGALSALWLFGMQLDLVGIIGIILLIGIVKKNGILLVDHAIQAMREEGLDSATAVRRAAVERFRPILMTTLAALLGALPLVLASGAGAELRRPLGVTIVGGLFVSQLLTLYTTPAVWLLMDRLSGWWGRRRGRAAGAAATAPGGMRRAKGGGDIGA